jgi:hypothetical protein
MNKNILKSYAPQARRDFIAAVTARAQQLGITLAQVQPVTVSGDVAIIDGTTWPAKVASQREALLKRIQRHGFGQTMEEVAYTWFNRFAALRYMELHDFLDHGRRALSSRDGGLPELLRHAAEVSLPGLNAAKVQEMQLAGNRDDELYKQLLVAQCNELSRSMPFLFERIDDDTELLLPDNLLRTDSIVAKLVAGVPEADWQEIEVIGWLYQFYISEKKDQVIGKVVKSEDIPAATQLFTPNWIVQYLVQNSVGRLWLMANPTSQLASEWPYYIQPAEQTPEVQAQLDALIQTRIREDGDALNPESITVLDPACGSGHILVVAYDVLKAIYLERGYRLRDIPRLILEKNLYGLDIDDRAAQMAGFALLMKARADDRRLLNDPVNPPQLNVLSLQESKGLKLDDLAVPLAQFGVQKYMVWDLIETFLDAKTFGSLIQIPYQLKTHLEPLAQVLELAEAGGDMYGRQAAQDLQPFVKQAQLLAMQFDAVVANPPYMGSKGMNPALKDYARVTFPDSKADLFAMFIERGFEWCNPSGFNSMVTMQSWMFLSSYEAMRDKLLSQRTLSCMVHMGNGVMGIAFGTAATVMLRSHFSDYAGSFSYCENDDIGEDEKPKAFPVQNERLKTAKPDDFKKIPGSPVGYWLTQNSLICFTLPKLGQYFDPQVGLQTSNTDRFIRLWHEVSFKNFCIDSQSNQAAAETGIKWFPLDKGGEFRRWYGNNTHAVNWINNGAEIKNYVAEKYPYLNGNVDYVIKDRGYFFRPGVTWGKISSGIFSVRATYGGSIFSDAGMKVPTSSTAETEEVSGFLNSTISLHFLKCLSPTLNFEKGSIAALPFKRVDSPVVRSLVRIFKIDWDEFEGSYEFNRPFLTGNKDGDSLAKSWQHWLDESLKRIFDAKYLEEENNRLYINAYGLQDELSPEVPEDQITLTRADREKDSQRLISYAIGCMLGRYSLDEPGLIYAHAGNVGFNPSRYRTFPADADGILPVTDEHWFEDDAPSRVREFLQAVWGPDTLAENLAWLAESLGTKGSETPEETIRRYIADKFYKDHLQTYKKRPIYWLFSSGKQGAFQALVYLHRYHEGTLARMRAEYVIPLSAKMAARLEMLEQDANAATSAAARTKVRKQIESLRKKQTELLAFDEQLRHYADMRITLDLDDGVKVNYGKFGDLLDSVKVVTGGSGDE